LDRTPGVSRRLGDIPEHRLMSDEYRRIEVITGTARRRRWSVEEKLRILGESCEPGESVSVVARRNGVAPNLLYRWRRLMHQGGRAPRFAGLPYREHAPDDARRELAERVVKHLEGSGVRARRAGRVLRQRPPGTLHSTPD
jgi:transposase-like protein